jgi:predicted house-cleaning noncanonical NTP pyrophosphatase (MazG superfamily)
LKKTGAAVETTISFDSIISSIEHYKLVRDKIPEKIKNAGEIAITKKLLNDEIFEQLKIKLVEEAFEAMEAKTIDDLILELADVLEVIDNIVVKKSIQKKRIYEAKQRQKSEGWRV